MVLMNEISHLFWHTWHFQSKWTFMTSDGKTRPWQFDFWHFMALMYDPNSERKFKSLSYRLCYLTCSNSPVGSLHRIQLQSKNQHDLMSVFRLRCPYMKDMYWMVISSPSAMNTWFRSWIELSGNTLEHRNWVLENALNQVPIISNCLAFRFFGAKSSN